LTKWPPGSFDEFFNFVFFVFIANRFLVWITLIGFFFLQIFSLLLSTQKRIDPIPFYTQQGILINKNRAGP